MSTTGKILGVAIKYNNVVYELPKPNRHHHVIRMIGGVKGPCIEGFYTSEGNFLNRVDAYALAVKTGQLNRDPNPKKYQGKLLFSEDLW